MTKQHNTDPRHQFQQNKLQKNKTKNKYSCKLIDQVRSNCAKNDQKQKTKIRIKTKLKKQTLLNKPKLFQQLGYLV